MDIITLLPRLHQGNKDDLASGCFFFEALIESANERLVLRVKFSEAFSLLQNRVDSPSKKP